MSRELAVYSTGAEWLSPQAFVDALRKLGLEAEWIGDDEPDDVTPWRAGRLRTSAGDTVIVTVMDVEEEVKDAVREEAAALGPDVDATASNMKTVYRFQGDGPLLAAVVDTASRKAPSLIVDGNEDRYWHRPNPNAPWGP